jgi:asparagine synthase (glutamine-hydrolysing)
MDNSDMGMQPFILGDKILLCNGEIFNYKELQKEYKLDCKSKSDCEVILHLVNKVGFEKAVRLLRGDFAFTLLDRNNVYFARDRIGVRPLFYGRTKSGNMAFASYARALSGFCKNIIHMKPGYGVYNRDTDKLVLKDYVFPEVKSVSEKCIYGKVRDTLIESVKLRLMSDRPIGCLLSGGLDSSLITSILCRLLGAENVRTYSIGMEGSLDLKNAKIVADYLGTQHTEVLFTPREGFDAIPKVIEDLESYDITTIRASVGMWLLARYISKNTEDIVLFSGEGADELLAGYLYFHSCPTSEELEKESLRLVKELYLYDALRADRCISSHGLELRVPFLDTKMIDLCLSLPGSIRGAINGIEKQLLRTSFSDGFLPKEVLWRRKDGFSDGVSGNKGKKWFEQIQEFVDLFIIDENYDNTFPSKEAQYYKKLYDNIFPTYQPKYNYWMPKWVETNGDPSGRILEIYDDE